MKDVSSYKLTQYASGSGCGCKADPSLLNKVLSALPEQEEFKNLLVGFQTKDDAAVWSLNDDQSIINTVDFFMPIVDDAFAFGQIAAANAINDVYAMGGKPLFANAILAWPFDVLPPDVASSALSGAMAVCRSVQVALAGGHSIQCKEPILGLSVTGVVANKGLKRNNTAQPGDLLFLTKPLGSGVISTAIKRGLAQPAHIGEAVSIMTQLNELGLMLSEKTFVHAMTDITGFGFLGHLNEMCEASNTSAEIFMNRIPVMPFVDEYLAQNSIPDNTYRNWNAIEKKVSTLNDMRSFQILNDPQTSGGLLIAVDSGSVNELQTILNQHKLEMHTKPVGRMNAASSIGITINYD
jgi:selenide,water dikinase